MNLVVPTLCLSLYPTYTIPMRRNRFFSYTETVTNYSIVADSELILGKCVKIKIKNTTGRLLYVLRLTPYEKHFNPIPSNPPPQHSTHTPPTALKAGGAGEHVEVVNSRWRPLVVEIGAMGALDGISKIAASVIAPLANQNVSVFCLSTNQDDYVLVRDV